MEEKKGELKELGIYEIIQRKKMYTENSELYQEKEMSDVKKGTIKAYEEMMENVMIMSEEKFINVYVEKVKELQEAFRKLEYGNVSTDVGELSGYNNTILEILSLYNPKYEFDLE